VDYASKTKIPIGTVQERRNQARSASNPLSLMKRARQIYAETPEDQMQIVVGEELLA